MAVAVNARKFSTHFNFSNTPSFFIMSEALGIKDKYTQIHGQRVAFYAKRLAKHLSLKGDHIRQITMGGMFHDIGKIAVSDQTLHNQSKVLSEEMLWEVRHHPSIGAFWLRRMNCVDDICNAVLYHHERLDGSGYPFGLKGSAIPLSAQIVSVADCFDAITTDRPYRPRKSQKRAFEALEEMADKTLAADLVTAFIREIEKNGMAHFAEQP
ncbi:MAG: HD domain-containing protein [Desulfobacteraceae bacterium]|nr:HD domain-containing protein [Desulfobacteraceae bacterium]